MINNRSTGLFWFFWFCWLVLLLAGYGLAHLIPDLINLLGH